MQKAAQRAWNSRRSVSIDSQADSVQPFCDFYYVFSIACGSTEWPCASILARLLLQTESKMLGGNTRISYLAL